MAAPKVYVSTYCNRPHRVSDGKPIEHECCVLPPAALALEIAGKYSEAIEVLRANPRKWMKRGVKA